MKKDIMKFFGYLGIASFEMIIKGYLLFKFLYWFIYPIIPKLPLVSYSQVVGILMFRVIFSDLNKKKEDEEMYDFISKSVIQPIVILVFGYVLHLIIR